MSAYKIQTPRNYTEESIQHSEHGESLELRIKLVLVWLVYDPFYSFEVVTFLLSSRLLSKNLKIKIYRTIILPVVLYGCETWLLTLREERKLRVFENMVLRRIFGPRRDKVTGEWSRLYNEELNDLYS